MAYEKKKSKPTCKDPMFNVTQMIREEQQSGEEKFVRSYSLDDESLKVILFFESQLDDICNFCCNMIQKCLLC